MMRLRLLIGLFALTFIAGCAEEPPKVGLDIGNIAPSLQGTDTRGDRINLADYKGKVVVVDFWATWCGPCVGMIPHEKSMLKHMEGRPVTLIGISNDDETKTLTDFIDKQGIAWPNIFDGRSGPITNSWHVDKFPTLFVIDAKGIIRYKFEGAVQFELDQAIDKLLSEANDKS